MDEASRFKSRHIRESAGPRRCARSGPMHRRLLSRPGRRESGGPRRRGEGRMRMGIRAVVLAVAVGAAGAGVVTACSTPAAGSAATPPLTPPRAMQRHHRPPRAVPRLRTAASASPRRASPRPASRPNCCRSAPDMNDHRPQARQRGSLARTSPPVSCLADHHLLSRGIRRSVPSRQSSGQAPARQLSARRLRPRLQHEP